MTSGDSTNKAAESASELAVRAKTSASRSGGQEPSAGCYGCFSSRKKERGKSDAL